MTKKNMSLVQRIRYLCDSKKISFYTLEKELGIANSSIRRWDTASPSIDKIIRVAEYFNVSIDYLIGHELEAEAKATSPEEKFAIRTFAAHLEGKEITEEKINDVTKYIDFVFRKNFD